MSSLRVDILRCGRFAYGSLDSRTVEFSLRAG